MELLPEVEFQADRLLKRRRLKSGQLEVLVKWKGFDDSMNTWEPYESVPDLPHLGALARLPESPVSESEEEPTEKGDDTFFIEKVLFEWTHPTTKRKTVLIKWQHFPISEVTWEPIDNIVNISGMKEDLLAARKRTLNHFPSQKRTKQKRKADKKQGSKPSSPKRVRLVSSSRLAGETGARKRRMRKVHSDSESTFSLLAAPVDEPSRKRHITDALPIDKVSAKQTIADQDWNRLAECADHARKKRRKSSGNELLLPEGQGAGMIVLPAGRHRWTIEVEKVVDGVPIAAELLHRDDGYTWSELMGRNVDPDDPAVLGSICLLVRELKRIADQHGPSYSMVLNRVQELCEYLKRRQRCGRKHARISAAAAVASPEGSMSAVVSPVADQGLHGPEQVEVCKRVQPAGAVDSRHGLPPGVSGSRAGGTDSAVVVSKVALPEVLAPEMPLPASRATGVDEAAIGGARALELATVPPLSTVSAHTASPAAPSTSAMPVPSSGPFRRLSSMEVSPAPSIHALPFTTGENELSDSGGLRSSCVAVACDNVFPAHGDTAASTHGEPNREPRPVVLPFPSPALDGTQPAVPATVGDVSTRVSPRPSSQNPLAAKKSLATRTRLDQVSAELRKRISQPGLETQVQSALESLRSNDSSSKASKESVMSPGQLSRQMFEINKQLSRASLDRAAKVTPSSGPNANAMSESPQRSLRSRSRETGGAQASNSARDSGHPRSATECDQQPPRYDSSMGPDHGQRAPAESTTVFQGPGNALPASAQPEAMSPSSYVMQQDAPHMVFPLRMTQPPGNQQYTPHLAFQSSGYEPAPAQPGLNLTQEHGSSPHFPGRQLSEPEVHRLRGSPPVHPVQLPVTQALVLQQQQLQHFQKGQRQAPAGPHAAPQSQYPRPGSRLPDWQPFPSGPQLHQQLHQDRPYQQNQQHHAPQYLQLRPLPQHLPFQHVHHQHVHPQHVQSQHQQPPFKVPRSQTSAPHPNDSQAYCPHAAQHTQAQHNRVPLSTSQLGTASGISLPSAPINVSRHPSLHGASKPAPRRLDRTICGVTVKESLLHAKLREASARSVGGLALERPVPSSKIRTRCYCGPRIERPPRETWVRACSLLRETVHASSLEEGLQCTVCLFRDHCECALAWVSSLPMDRTAARNELSQFVKQYICVACRIILVEPLAMVDRVLTLAVVQAPTGPVPKQDNQKVITKSVTMEFNLGRSELEELRDGHTTLQVRGILLSPSTLQYSAFPNQVTFYLNAKDSSAAPPECVIRPPAPHRKRKELPWDVPLRMYQGCPNNKLHMVCQFAEANLSKAFMFTVVIVHRVSATAILLDIRSGSQLPNALARSVCRALFTEASRITEDEVQIEQRDSAFLSLRCPSTLMPIELPGRGFHCMHIQCFDLEYYVSSQAKIASHKHRWKCPVCDKPCYPHDLLIDHFCQEILEATTEQDKKVFLTFGDVVSWRVTEREEDNDETEEGLLGTKEEGNSFKQTDIFKPTSNEGSVIDLD